MFSDISPRAIRELPLQIIAVVVSEAVVVVVFVSVIRVRNPYPDCLPAYTRKNRSVGYDYHGYDYEYDSDSDNGKEEKIDSLTWKATADEHMPFAGSLNPEAEPGFPQLICTSSKVKAALKES